MDSINNTFERIDIKIDQINETLTDRLEGSYNLISKLVDGLNGFGYALEISYPDGSVPLVILTSWINSVELPTVMKKVLKLYIDNI